MWDRDDSIHETFARTFDFLLAGTNAETGDWRGSGFIEWLRDPEQRLYWISGKAGSGKSTLMKHLCNDPRLKENLQCWNEGGGEDVVLAGFYFFDRGKSDFQKSREGLIRSLLHQILTQRKDLMSRLNGLQLPDTQKNESWTWTQLWTVFNSLIALTDRPVKFCLLVDGLDEFNNSEILEAGWDNHSRAKLKADGHSEIAKLFQDIAKNPNVKLCLASRPLDRFGDVFTQFQHLKLEDLTAKDIKIYVTGKLNQNTTIAKLAQEEEEGIISLAEDIVSKASGVFLWVELVIGLLIDGLQDRDYLFDLRRKVEALPEELGGPRGLYMRMLHDVKPEHRQQGALIIRLVQCAHTSLTPLMLSLAETLDDQKAIATPVEKVVETPSLHESRMAGRLKSRCAGLLEVQKQKVVFYHQTVKEFLEQPFVWKFLGEVPSDESSRESNIYLCLFRAFLVLVKQVGIFKPRPFAKLDYESIDLVWSFIFAAMKYAKDVERTRNGGGDDLMLLLDELDRTGERMFSGILKGIPCCDIHKQSWSLKGKARHWVDMEPRRISFVHQSSMALALIDSNDADNFLTFAIEVGLAHYVMEKIQSMPQSCRSKPGRPLLDYAVMLRVNPSKNRPYFSQVQSDPVLVECLLRCGSDPNQRYVIDIDDGEDVTCSTWDRALRRRYEIDSNLPGETVTCWAQILKLLLMYNAEPNRVLARHSREQSALGSVLSELVWFPEERQELLAIFLPKRCHVPAGGARTSRAA